MSEALATAGACKTQVAEFIASRGVVPATLAESGCSDIASKYAMKDKLPNRPVRRKDSRISLWFPFLEWVLASSYVFRDDFP